MPRKEKRLGMNELESPEFCNYISQDGKLLDNKLKMKNE